MEEHLTIRNFGPIREADIQLRDLTIFVGPQATGKSLAAQALYFLRGLEDLLSPSTNAPRESVLSALQWWLGNEPSVYTKPGTLLRWNDFELSQEERQQVQWEQNSLNPNDAMKKRIQTWWEKGTQHAKTQVDYSKTQVYIPAGRTLYSFLTLSSALPLISRFRPEQQWPGYIITFYETLGKALERLSRDQGQVGLFSDSVSLRHLEQEIQPILKGQIQYSHDTIVLKTEQVLLRPVNIATGQMEVWPFWAIIESGLKSGTLAPGSQIYFEEPEAHLHPGAQRSVMAMVAFLVRRGVRVLLTTHSPYILYAVNNFLMAQKVLDAGHTLPADVLSETALRPEQVAAYRFSPDGSVHNIMDMEVGLIDEDELDQVADDLGATFTRLQERLEGAA